MTRVVCTSDLHLGITTEAQLRDLVPRIAAEQPDLTVLAGDIGEGYDNFVACLAIFAGLPGQVAVLAGNHDLWARGGRTSTHLWQRDLPEATRAAGMLWLEGTQWQADGLGVVGSVGWYDYSAADPTLPPYTPEYFALHKGEYNLDDRFIDWAWTDGEFARSCGDTLCASLDALEGDAAVHSVLVVTHVPLFELQMARKPQEPRWGFSNAYFGNLTLGGRVLAASTKLVAVVSGHTHIGKSGTVAHPDYPDLPSVPVEVIPSDYGAPTYTVVERGR